MDMSIKVSVKKSSKTNSSFPKSNQALYMIGIVLQAISNEKGQTVLILSHEQTPWFC